MNLASDQPPRPPSRCDTPLSYLSVTPEIHTDDVTNDGVDVVVDLEFENPKTSTKWPQCNYCEKTFSNTSNKNKHVKKMHSNLAVPNKIRLEHIEKDPDIYPWVCGERLKNEDGLMVGVCHQSFKILRSLGYHKQKTHYKNNPCKECGKVFGEKKDLQRHEQRVHKKTKNYICPNSDCKKSFFAAQEFQRHSNTCKYKSFKSNVRFILPNDANNITFKNPQSSPSINIREHESPKICEIPEQLPNEASLICESQNIPAESDQPSLRSNKANNLQFKILQSPAINIKEAKSPKICETPESLPNEASQICESQNIPAESDQPSLHLNDEINLTFKIPQSPSIQTKESESPKVNETPEPLPNEVPNICESQSISTESDQPRLPPSNQMFDWYSLVARHKTTRFGIVPLPPGPVPGVLGNFLKLDPKANQEWRIEIPRKDADKEDKIYVDVETFVYKDEELPNTNTENSLGTSPAGEDESKQIDVDDGMNVSAEERNNSSPTVLCTPFCPSGSLLARTSMLSTTAKKRKKKKLFTEIIGPQEL